MTPVLVGAVLALLISLYRMRRAWQREASSLCQQRDQAEDAATEQQRRAGALARTVVALRAGALDDVPMQRVWAVSAVALRESPTAWSRAVTARGGVTVVPADSQESAASIALEIARREWPESEGWVSHRSTATEVEPSEFFADTPKEIAPR